MTHQLWPPRSDSQGFLPRREKKLGEKSITKGGFIKYFDTRRKSQRGEGQDYSSSAGAVDERQGPRYTAERAFSRGGFIKRRQTVQESRWSLFFLKNKSEEFLTE